MTTSLRTSLARAAGGAAALAASGAALAHPGHGAELFHQHGEWLVALLALCAVGGLAWRLLRGRSRGDSAPRD